MFDQPSKGQRTLFTSDNHFGHAGIIGQCNRPFSGFEEMDESMIQDWNSEVRDRDRVIHLGDFAYKSKRVAEIFSRLKGEKHLIRGNHDKHSTTQLGWKSVSMLDEIVLEGKRIVLCHYALRSWAGFHRGSLHFFGHSHSGLQGSRRCLDVGVDSIGYRPMELGQLLPIMETLPELIFSEGQPYVPEWEDQDEPEDEIVFAP